MKRYRKDIDGIKGVAIVSVILFHLGLFKYGYLGVDLFFLVHGFFIIPQIYNLKGNCFRHTVKNLLCFWERRILRLWPLILLACTISLAIGYYIMLPDDYENLSESVIASSLFTENILSAITTKDYWNISNNYRPLMHLWYVGILVQFYIVTPLIILALQKVAWRVRKCKDLIILLALGVISFVACINPETSNVSKFYYLPYRFWEFAVGGLLAMVNIQILKDKYSIGIIINIIKKLLSWNLLTIIGKMSFSLYVWHHIILAFYRYFISESFTMLFIICYCIILIAISYTTFIIIEKSSMPKHRYFFLSILFMLMLNICSYSIYVHAGVVRDVPELNIKADNVHRHLHSEYVDGVYLLNREFQESNPHPKVLVVGNSFARDFVNMMIEGDLCDELDISYSRRFNDSIMNRIRKADLIFTTVLKHKIPDHIWHSIDSSKIYGIGTKSFGHSMGIIYSKRNRSDYYETTAEPDDSAIEKYHMELKEWGEKYIDMMEPVMDKNGKVRVFTDNKKYISQDTRHLTKEGAKFYANKINIQERIKELSKKKNAVK